MKVKTILVTVHGDVDPKLGKGISARCAVTGGGKCFLSLFSSARIVAHGVYTLFSQSHVYLYESSADSPPSPPHDGPPPPS